MKRDRLNRVTLADLRRSSMKIVAHRSESLRLCLSILHSLVLIDKIEENEASAQEQFFREPCHIKWISDGNSYRLVLYNLTFHHTS